MQTLVKGGGDLIDAEALAKALRKKIQGEVRFSDADRALYATDASNYRQVPIGVVLPKTKEDILTTVAECRNVGAPILSRGGGTSLAGQCCNVAVMIDMSKYYHKILSLDPQAKQARIQPGIVLDVLRKAANQYQLTFGPDPATHTHCTLGGMMGNNSCGTHALMAGKTVDNVVSLEILTYDGEVMEVGGALTDEALQKIIGQGGRRGEIYGKLKSIRDRYGDLVRARYPKIPRRVSGYNLDDLLPEKGFDVAKALIGTESTCVTILEATVRLVDNPKHKSLVVMGYPDVYVSADQVPEILKFKPIALEGVDDQLVEKMKTKKAHSKADLLPEGKGWLYVEFGGDTKEKADAQAAALMARMKLSKPVPAMKLFDEPAEEKEVWEIRESGLGATAFIKGQPDTWEGWEDSAVDPAQLGAYLRELRALYEKYEYAGALYGHFGQGCVHTRITFDLFTEPGVKKFRAFIEEAADLAIKHNGSFSGEHGDGQSRAELLPKMFGPELIEAFREFKSAWDPLGKMNPGKVVDAYKITDNLRLGSGYNPAHPTTYFPFQNDHYEFSRAALRCVGVGKCRREDDMGTMCPSYRVTRDDKDSTRGRTRMLFEMLRGETIKDGWKSEAVKESLDLCLSCKGCKSDCPVNVDMATYKAEFLAHYYEGKLRPRHAYAFGWIYHWARLASIAPGIVNFFTQTPGLSRIAKWFAGAAPQRRIPKFAPRTFTSEFRKRLNVPPPSALPSVGLSLSRKDASEGRTSAHQSTPLARVFAGEGRAERSAAEGEGTSKKVILWPDTFNNHFFPNTLQSAVDVLERLGYDVQIPSKSVCCGRPLYDYGFLNMAKRRLRHTLDVLREPIRAGTPIIGLEPSCMAVFRDELPHLFHDDEDAKRMSKQTFLFSEFINQHVKEAPLPKIDRKALVQGHCHHKAVMTFKDEKEIFKRMGIEAEMPEDGCCGMAGAFGFEEGEHYNVAKACGERALLPVIRQSSPDALLMADGFSCREQIWQETGRRAKHLAEVLAEAYDSPKSNVQSPKS